MNKLKSLLQRGKSSTSVPLGHRLVEGMSRSDQEFQALKSSASTDVQLKSKPLIVYNEPNRHYMYPKHADHIAHLKRSFDVFKRVTLGYAFRGGPMTTRTLEELKGEHLNNVCYEPRDDLPKTDVFLDKRDTWIDLYYADDNNYHTAFYDMTYNDIELNNVKKSKLTYNDFQTLSIMLRRGSKWEGDVVIKSHFFMNYDVLLLIDSMSRWYRYFDIRVPSNPDGTFFIILKQKMMCPKDISEHKQFLGKIRKFVTARMCMAGSIFDVNVQRRSFGENTRSTFFNDTFGATAVQSSAIPEVEAKEITSEISLQSIPDEFTVANLSKHNLEVSSLSDSLATLYNPSNDKE